MLSMRLYWLLIFVRACIVVIQCRFHCRCCFCCCSYCCCCYGFAPAAPTGAPFVWVAVPLLREILEEWFPCCSCCCCCCCFFCFCCYSSCPCCYGCSSCSYCCPFCLGCSARVPLWLEAPPGANELQNPPRRPFQTFQPILAEHLKHWDGTSKRRGANKQ